jgi:NADP-dependent 3-hydroxy acid dehydrogenase YdfG
MASRSETVCLIVGAGPGISLAVARCFGAEGFKLGLIARQTDKLEDVSHTLRAEGFDSCTATADAGDEDFLRNAIRSIHDKAGETQVLIYNAFAATPSNPSNLALAQLVQDFG